MTKSTEEKRAMSTVEQALGEFELVAGTVGSEEEKKACAMSLVAYVRGEGFIDHPPCAHNILSDAVIRAFDHGDSTAEMRRALTLSAEQHVVDTWWVPGTVLAAAFALTEKDEEISPYDRTVRALERVTAWKGAKERPNLSSADLSYANLSSADLRYADLSYADLRSAVLRSADLSYADLSYADLSSAVLRSADLSYADLSSADLRSAKGNAETKLPPGWKVNESGLIVPLETVAA